MSPEVIEWLFPTPIAVFDLTECVTDEIDNVLQKIGYTTNSLVEGIRGNQDPSKIPELKSLYGKFQECVNSYSAEIGIEHNYIYESWMNILFMNGSVGAHRHFDSVISGAYYPYVDEGSAPIIFNSPIEGYRMIDTQKCIGDNGVYTSNVKSIDAKTGKLVLFPSWLQHYVPTNKTEMRITLSFNTKF